MATNEQRYRLQLIGPFGLLGPDGARIEISSKRGQALLAMLVCSGGGERTRGWLQDRLWGSRGSDQAQASLRRELSTLRKAVNVGSAELLRADNSRIWIDLSLIDADWRNLGGAPGGEFLEGIDIGGEESFEDWLREERMRLEGRTAPKALPLSATYEAPALPSDFAEFSIRPAIAVLPFTWATKSDDREAIAHGLSEDLIDRLSKLRWLPVIARSSCFALMGQNLDARAAGEKLGARYIVEGSMRGDGDQRILSASLTDAVNGQILWSNRLPFAEGGDQAGFDEMLSSFAATLGLKVDQSEQVRALSKSQSDLNVSELIWRGRWHMNRLTREDAKAARACFDDALQREPTSPEALIQATWVRLWDLWLTRGSETDIRAIRQMAQQSIIADYDDARGHMLAGIAEIWLKQPLRAEALLRRAIDLNPSLVMAHAQLGSALNLQGDYDAAVATLNFALRLSPNDHDLFFTLGELSSAHLLNGSMNEALYFAEQSIARRGAYWLAHVVKVNALVRSGRAVEAGVALSDLFSAKTNFREEYIDWLPFLDSQKCDYLREGLNLCRQSGD